MNLLWQKDPSNPELYVDIFKNISTKGQDLDSHSELFSEISAKLTAINFYEKDNNQSTYYRKRGNKKFEEEKWLESLSFYNRSL